MSSKSIITSLSKELQWCLKIFPWKEVTFILSSWITKPRFLQMLLLPLHTCILWEPYVVVPHTYTLSDKHFAKMNWWSFVKLFPFWINIWNIFYIIWVLHLNASFPRESVFSGYSLMAFLQNGPSFLNSKLPSTGRASTLSGNITISYQ